MIPVTPKPEPEDFDTNVRQPGHQWLANYGIPLNSVPPKARDLPNYWTRCGQQLWNSYEQTCAYLAIHFELVTGAASTDHFVAKSRHAGDAYEWSNYRLSALGPNRKKRDFNDVLDPFTLQAETFVLNLTTGQISPSPTLSASESASAQATIDRLDLDSPEHNEMRARHFRLYLSHRTESILRLLSPFVWSEARRQNLL